ncbi:205_t:CDS:2, partial [Acaulospora morrowiae]
VAQSSSSLPQSNSINRPIAASSTQSNALQSSGSSAPPATPLTTVPTPTPQNFNPSYFKQQQDQPTSAAYLNQQHHLGLAAEPINAPYGSYLHSQPPNQLSGFGIGPMQSLPDYGALYGPDAQRVMGYYADPSYGQASPVTSAGYQNRENNKYTPDTTTNSSQSSTQQASTQQQSTNQQGQNPQQPYPVGVPYYPYYYLPSYQQSG